MFRKLLPALVGCALSAFTGTAVAETQVDPGGGQSISATPGWISWQRPSSEWLLWHGGALVQAPQASSRVLGTDTHGRAVAVDWPCSTCHAVMRRLADGSVRPLARRVVGPADENRGTLAYVRRDLG